MTPVQIFRAAVVCAMAIAMTITPPATAAAFGACAYLAGRELTRRMP